MEKKLDRRTLYTQGVIKEAFVQLLQEMPFEKITVTAICKLAEINRGTFYIHFYDPYDLLKRLEEECRETMLVALKNIDFDDDAMLDVFEITAFIQQIVKSDPLVDLLLSIEPSKAVIWRQFFDDLATQLTPRLMTKYGLTEGASHAMYTFLFAGFQAVTNFFYQAQKSPEEVEAIKRVIDGFVMDGFSHLSKK